jgi:predicted HTH transcriptional regulator
MSQQEYQSRLIKYSMPNYDFSARLINGSTIEDLDNNAINELREKLKKSKRVTFEIPHDNIQLLKNIHLMQDEKITYAGLVLL